MRTGGLTRDRTSLRDDHTRTSRDSDTRATPALPSIPVIPRCLATNERRPSDQRASHERPPIARALGSSCVLPSCRVVCGVGACVGRGAATGVARAAGVEGFNACGSTRSCVAPTAGPRLASSPLPRAASWLRKPCTGPCGRPAWWRAG